MPKGTWPDEHFLGVIIEDVRAYNNDIGRLLWNSLQIWIFVNTPTLNFMIFFLCKSSVPSSSSQFQEKKDKSSSSTLLLCCLLLCHHYYWCCNFWFCVNTANYNQITNIVLEKRFKDKHRNFCTITRKRVQQH